MNTKKLQLSLALGLLALAGALVLLGTLGTGPPVAHAWPVTPMPSPTPPATRPPGPAFVKPGGTGGWCLQNDPCGSIQYAIDECEPGNGDTIHVAAGTYTNTGAAVVTITKSITLYGGWDGSPTGDVVRGPSTYTTTLDAQGNGRVIYITGNITPTVEGLQITGGNDSGLGGAPSGYDAGGGIYIRYAEAVISGCVVYQNTSNMDGGGVYLRQSDAYLNDNTIRANTSKYGGGLEMYKGSPTLIGNIIEDNAARDAAGGGIYAESSAFTLQHNTVQSNTAVTGGGIYGVSDSNAVIEANTVRNNTATWSGGGLYLRGSGPVTLLDNLIRQNTAQYSGSTSGRGGGLYAYCGGPFPLQRNTFEGNVAESQGGAAYFEWCSGNHATLENNVMVDNQAAGAGGAFVSSKGGLTLLHTTLAHNTGTNGVYVTNGSTLVFTNTIVYSHTVGVNNAGGTVSMTHTLWQSYTTRVAGTVSEIDWFTGTVAFAADGYHLTAASDAIDHPSSDTGVEEDIDGEPRWMGEWPDLGADEYPFHADLSLSKVRQGSGPAEAGDPITFTLTVSNAATSEWAADARVVDTLSPESAVTALNASTPGGDCTAAGAVVTCTLYDVATDTQRTTTVWVTTTATYDGILTDTATVTPMDAVDPDGANNGVGPVTVTVVYVPPVPDLGVDKAAPAYAKPGETIVYTVTWGNNGSAAATLAALTDTLPTGVSFVAASPPQTSGPNPLVWNLGDVAPGAGGTHVVTVTVNSGLADGTVLTNTAEIATAENKDDHDYPGIAYTATLTVTLPNNNAIFSESNPPPNLQVSDQEWVWKDADIVDAGQDDICITIMPSAPDPNGDYHVHAEISSETPECCQPNHPNQADAHTYRVDVGFQKEAKASKWMWLTDPQSGEINGRYEQEYYLDFRYHNTNPGRPDVADYSVTDILPSELTFDSAACQPPMDIQLIDDQTVVWSMLSDFPLHVDDRAWMRLKGESGVLDASKVLTNRATLSYTLSAQEQFTNSAVATSTVPLVPPLITRPGNGGVCDIGNAQVEVQGLAQPGVEVVLYVDNGSGFIEDTYTMADASGAFTVATFSMLPWTFEGWMKIYAKARDPDNLDRYSGESNHVEVWISQAFWCPQRSYWEGTVKAGPLKGQHMTFHFRNSAGDFAAVLWDMPGVYGFWDTDLHLYSCCEEPTQAFTVTADDVVYTPVSHDGHWYHFRIGQAHDVTIWDQCGDETSESNGDVLIDPDGFVFDVDEGGDYSGEGGMFNPVQAVSGVTVTCMVSMPQWGGWVPWPAHVHDDQVNPQVTDDTYDDGITTTGYYAFFTPPGHYYLDVQGIEGYQHWRSPVVEVITQIVHVNLPYTPWPAGDVYTVTLTADGPAPAVITIPVGSAVQWVSALRASDTITDLMAWSENPILRPLSDLDPLENTRGFDAGYLEPGRVYRRQFTWQGTYAYTDAAGHSGQVVVEAPPSCIPLSDVEVTGPLTGSVGAAYNFTATVNLISGTATLPVVYTWEATGQEPVSHTSGLSDTVLFAWTAAGHKGITVTAVNPCGTDVSDDHVITVEGRIYLPLVLRNW